MDIRQTLSSAVKGEHAAAKRLTDTLYSELREIAARRMHGERLGHTLLATDLLDEAIVRLLGKEDLLVSDRQHLIALASLAMQRVLIDHARGRGAQRRRGDHVQVPLEDVHPAAEATPDALAILANNLVELEAVDARKGQIARLRLLGGMSNPEVADLLAVSVNTVGRDWKLAQEWLLKKLP